MPKCYSVFYIEKTGKNCSTEHKNKFDNFEAAYNYVINLIGNDKNIDSMSDVVIFPDVRGTFCFSTCKEANKFIRECFARIEPIVSPCDFERPIQFNQFELDYIENILAWLDESPFGVDIEDGGHIEDCLKKVRDMQRDLRDR